MPGGCGAIVWMGVPVAGCAAVERRNTVQNLAKAADIGIREIFDILVVAVAAGVAGRNAGIDTDWLHTMPP